MDRRARLVAAHQRAARTHERAALVHDRAAVQAHAVGDPERECVEQRLAAAQRGFAALERERAADAEAGSPFGA